MGNASYKKKKRKERKYDHFKKKEWDQIFKMMNLDHDTVCDLFDMFGDIDVDGTSGVSCDEFLIFFAVDQTRAFAARIFGELDVDKSGEIDFLEFVVCVWNLCTLTSESIAKFLFELYDNDDSGLIEFNELAIMISDMMGRRVDNRTKTQNARIAKNIQHEVHKMLAVIKEKSADLLIGDPEDDDCAVDHAGFDKLISLHFDLFAPVYDIQRVLRAKVMGLEFWRKQIKFRAENRLHHLMKTMPRKLQDMRNRETAMKIARQEYVSTGNKLGLKRIMKEEKRKLKEAAREEEERLRRVEAIRYEEDLRKEAAGGPKARRASVGGGVFSNLKQGNVKEALSNSSKHLSRMSSSWSGRSKKTVGPVSPTSGRPLNPGSPKKGGKDKRAPVGPKGFKLSSSDELSKKIKSKKGGKNGNSEAGMKIMNMISTATGEEEKEDLSLDEKIAQRKKGLASTHSATEIEVKPKPSGRKSQAQIHKEAISNVKSSRLKKHDSTKLLVGL